MEAVEPSSEATLAGSTQAWKIQVPGSNADPASDALRSLGKGSHLPVSPLIRERMTAERCSDVPGFVLAAHHLLEQRALFGEGFQVLYAHYPIRHGVVSHLISPVEGPLSFPVCP